MYMIKFRSNEHGWKNKKEYIEKVWKYVEKRNNDQIAKEIGEIGVGIDNYREHVDYIKI